MRKLIAIYLMLIVSSLFAQTADNNQRYPTMEEVKEVLENAYMDIIMEKENFIKVKNRTNFFVDIDASKQRYLSLNISYAVKEDIDVSKIKDYVNRVNSEVLMINCYYLESKEGMYFRYYWWIEGGEFDPKVFIKTTRSFESAVLLALQKDEEQILK